MRQLKQSTVRVTPKIATEWLEANTHNREINDGRVKIYAERMLTGKWRLNGAAVIFDSNGVIVDGQHRLWACVEANVPFETAVTEGVAPDVFPTIDEGLKRSNKDNVFIDGVKKHSRVHAIAIRVILHYESGTVLCNRMASSQDIVAWLREHGDISEWVELAMGKKVWATAYAGYVVAVCYLAGRRYPDKAKEFMTSFMLGENLQAGSPVLALRNRFGTDKKMSRVERLALIVQAWNAYAENRKMARMMLFVGDKFPKIKGA